jgi:hypothetical protein
MVVEAVGVLVVRVSPAYRLLLPAVLAAQVLFQVFLVLQFSMLEAVQVLDMG